MFSICPYSWPQLLPPPMMLVPAQRVPSPLFFSVFPLAVLVSFSRLVPRLTPRVGFGLVPYAEHDLSTSIACVVLVY